VRAGKLPACPEGKIKLLEKSSAFFHKSLSTKKRRDRFVDRAKGEKGGKIGRSLRSEMKETRLHGMEETGEARTGNRWCGEKWSSRSGIRKKKIRGRGALTVNSGKGKGET